MRKGLFMMLMLAAVGQLGWGWYIPAKAQLAQWLLQRAWQQGQIQHIDVRPWPWADIAPVARLQLPQRHVDLIVLNGDSGAALAFGPGLRQLGASGKVKMISAHRDTQFHFLQQVYKHEQINLLYRDGEKQRYQIVEKKIVDSRKPLQLHASNSALLILVTCYPFNAIQPGGPLRYLVIARQLITPGLPIKKVHYQL